MQTNKILSADLLDLIFDNRNKAYGAYELRKHYERRITKAMMITGGVITLFITGVVLGNSSKPVRIASEDSGYKFTTVVEKPDPVVQPKVKQVVVPVKTIQFTAPQIVDKQVIDNPPPDNDDLHNAKIDLVTKDDPVDNGIDQPKGPDNNKGIIEAPKDNADDNPVSFVEVQAKYAGDWKKFLERNLDPQVPVDNGAPTGNYTIIIQFVVDKDGNVSDIKPMTNIGYGMEQEAIRVLKKATRWEPAIQNGHVVKAYRSQPITFQVLGDQ